MEFQTLDINSFPSIVGLADVKKQLLSALVLQRHVVLVGNPGMGKTTLVRDVATLLKTQELNTCEFHCKPDNPVCPYCKDRKEKGERIPTKQYEGRELFVRVQGSPDLTVEDLIGDIDPIKAMEYGPLSPQAFTPGKIFKANNGVLFFDELNRCSQRLQNALLQVLEEKKVTIGSYDVDIPVNLLFIGTMNPQDTNTEPLSDVLLDRFDLIYVHYPGTQHEEEHIVRMKGRDLIEFPKELYSQMILFLRRLRSNKDLEKVPSVRASLGLYERSQAVAKLNNHAQVKPLDIMEALTSVIAHRIKLKPSLSYVKDAKAYLKDEFGEFCNEQGLTLSDEGESP
ncbi:MAG: AAA family ATPase [Candidatus Woesearchaeota archaeon]